MKKIIVSMLFASLFIQANAQRIDTNLPEGRFGLKTVTSVEKAKIKLIPDLQVNLSRRAKAQRIDGASVSHIDNTLNKFFPPIVSQISNSCGCASNVHYIYNYELNYLLDRNGKLEENIADYMHIWNFMNDGVAQGTFTWDVFDTIDDNGAIPKSIYTTKSITEWANGYEMYHSGMINRIKGYSKLNPSRDGDLEKMKQYLIDHANGSAHGGLIQFSGFAHPLAASNYNGPQETGIEGIIPMFGTSGMHSMTIAGFDDTVEWDYNKDGNISDDEKGAFICVNSWGTSWGDNGKFYAPYKTFTTLRQGQGGTGNGGKECYMVTPEIRDVKMALKVRVNHTSRNDLSFKVGYADSESATKPKMKRVYKSMNIAGGDFKMTGKSGSKSEQIEFGIDITDLCNKAEGITTPAFFLEVNDRTLKTAGEGEVVYCTLIDYRDNTTTEYLGEMTSSKLEHGKKVLVKIKMASSALNDNKGTDFCGFDASVSGRLINIFVNARQKANLEIEIIEESGAFVAPVFNNAIPQGSFTTSFNAKSLFAGKYLLRVTTDNQVMYKSIDLK